MDDIRRISIRFGLFAVAVLAVTALPGSGFGQTESYPSRPIRVIVPFPPGGSLDFNARAIVDKFSEILGQHLVIDNRSGASGTIGTALVARSVPDGYTLLLHTIPFITSAILYKSAGYDPLNDFAPISLLSTVPMAVSVHPSLPVRSVKELIALALSRPGELNYGSAGIGSNSHITGELFNMLGKIALVPIHYKGGGPSLAAVVSGEVPIAFSNVSQTARMVEAKRLRPLGVSSLRPSSALPGIPPVAESGLPGFEFMAWHGLLAPKATPAAIVGRLNKTLRSTLADPGILQRFEKGGLDPIANSPHEYADYLKSEQEKWRRVIRERNIRAE
jgi:tripartite-type tricarboxylate transporter receptor subunit TctC